MVEMLESFPLWKRLVLISKINKILTAKQISCEIGDAMTNSYFRNVLKFIEINNFCKVNKRHYPFLYEIKCEKLAQFLREGMPFKLSEELIKLTTAIYSY